MITVNGKEYRNLVEQVLKNKEDIARHYDADRVLEDYGIKIVGSVDTESQLPPANTYDGAYGDAYTVGTAAPYDFYVFTRPLQGETENRWLDLGALAIEGPEGPQGPMGPKGDTGESSKWYVGQGVPYGEGHRDGDMYLNKNTGDVYNYTSNVWSLVANIKGNTGAQGPVGPQGPTGEQGPQGIQGEAGVPGDAVKIVGILSSVDMLPDPTTLSRDSAYVIQETTGQWLYFITGLGTTDNPLIWNRVAFENGTTVLVNGEPVQTFDADTKADKMTSPSAAYNVAPVFSNSGTQYFVRVIADPRSIDPQSGSRNVPTYFIPTSTWPEGITVKGVLYTGDPQADIHCTNKKYVDEQITAMGDSKVSSVGISNKIYCTDGYGNDTTRTISLSPLQGALPIYSDGGYLKTNTPTADTHCANKKYVDETIAAAQAEHQKKVVYYAQPGSSVIDVSSTISNNPGSIIKIEAAPTSNTTASYGLATAASGSTKYTKIVIYNTLSFGNALTALAYTEDGTIAKLTISTGMRLYAQTQPNVVELTIVKISDNVVV